MRFYRSLLATKPPSALKLVDVALVLALLPHLFVQDIVMVFYMFAVLLFLSFSDKRGNMAAGVFGMLGFAGVVFTFMGAFNYVGLSELSTYVSLISALLIVAVSMQRLSGQVNFYIAISPMLLLALSYFFYNTIFMLFYAISTLFVFLFLLLWYRMRSSFLESMRSSLMLMTMSLPVVVLLFMVFPRISFETKDFGFRETKTIRTGHDGLMHIGTDALLVPSRKIVMEVWFDAFLPKEEELYFRGSVLYKDLGETWVPLNESDVPPYKKESAFEGEQEYTVTLYPHRKRWLFTLDYPLEADAKSKMDADKSVRMKHNIEDVFRYRARSALKVQSEENAFVPEAALALHHGRDLQSEGVVATLVDAKMSDTEKLQALVEWFKNLQLGYTLQPEALDMQRPVDSFLFETKEGYCVHFASSFATLSRMAGIPARVVTGFRGNLKNAYENYLVVKEEDAHAWAEVYLQGRGWVRVEATAYASLASQIEGELQGAAKERSLFAQLQLFMMYVKYVINEWILEYDRLKQIELLKTLMNSTVALLQAVASFAVLIAVGVAGYMLLKKERCSHEALCALQPLFRRLKRHGIYKDEHETMQSFFDRLYETYRQDELLRMNELYHKIRYAEVNDAVVLNELRRLAKDFSVKKVIKDL